MLIRTLVEGRELTQPARFVAEANDSSAAGKRKWTGQKWAKQVSPTGNSVARDSFGWACELLLRQGNSLACETRAAEFSSVSRFDDGFVML